MATQEEKQAKEIEERDKCIQIKNYVLDRLGEPKNLSRVHVIRVGVIDHRVNIYITDDKLTHIVDMHNERISDSFFVRETPNKFITTPVIIKKYK